MNILIITSYFPPDTAIAAVRPYMFATHLSEGGNKVTVLRTGLFFKAPFDEYTSENGFEVISALGSNCPAERFKRNEYEGYVPKPLSKGHYLPRGIKLSLKFLIDAAAVINGKPPKRLREPCAVLSRQKKCIDRLYRRGRCYDVVFSTCGSIENIYAGRYAANVFGAKWIMDFRDPMVRRGKQNDDFWWNRFGKEATECAVKNADCITAVSCGLADVLRSCNPSANVRVIYNGFDDRQQLPKADTAPNVLSLCYTGTVYDDQKTVLERLAECIARLIKQKRIGRNDIKVNYAGTDFKAFQAAFGGFGISDVLEDKGYLSKNDTLKLQLESDVFTVFSWNTKQSRGILTGKFYEGIKCGKTILALVSGDTPGSELMQLQKKYGYGFCYEQAGPKNMMCALEEYIERLCQEKKEKGSLSYKQPQELYDTFSYTNLTKELFKLMAE